VGSKSIGDGDDDGGGKGGEDMYKGSVEPMLVLLSDLYSDKDNVSISDSRLSSCFAYTITDYFYLLTTALRKM